MASTFKIIQAGKQAKKTTIYYSIIGDVIGGDIGIETSTDIFETVIIGSQSDSFEFIHSNPPLRFFITIEVPYSDTKRDIQFSITNIGGSGTYDNITTDLDGASLSTNSSSLEFNCELIPNHGAEFSCKIKDCIIDGEQYGDIIFGFALSVS